MTLNDDEWGRRLHDARRRQPAAPSLEITADQRALTDMAQDFSTSPKLMSR